MKEIVFNEDKILVKLLSKAKVNHLEVFSKMDFGPKKTKMTRLFELMRDNDFNSPAALKTALYGKSVKSDGNFIRKYNKFQEKLYNTLLFIDTNSPMYIERARAYFVSARRMVLARKLFDLGTKQLAIDLAEKTLPLCQKFEFTDLTIILSKLLMREYGGTLLELKKYKKYKQIYASNMDLYKKESILEKYVNDIDYKENASKKKSLEVDSESLSEAYNYAIDFSENFPSIEILTITSRIIQYYFSINKNPELYHQKSDIILKYLLEKRFE